jgi:hypothetical protein
MAWINGRGHNDGRLEAVEPVETVAKIGLERLVCKKMIQCCIDNVRKGRENSHEIRGAHCLCKQVCVYTNNNNNNKTRRKK